MLRTVIIFLVFAAWSASARSQSTSVDLTMSNNRQGQVEIRVRTSADFDGCPSALTFTVRWPASAGMALDTAVRCYPFQDVMPVNAVAPQINGEYMYRTFNGFSISTLADWGLVWRAGREYPICTADVLVPGTTFELVDDAWTDANNRSFYCSLGGDESTGVYFPSPEPAVSIRSMDQGTGSLDVALTPQDDFFGWVTDLTFTVRWPSNAGVSLGTTFQDPEVAEYLAIEKVGGEVSNGGFTYQVFRGTGQKSIANSDDVWWNAAPVTVISIPFTGTTDALMITNDAWTNTHDANYAIMLNGVDRTGELEDLATAITPATPSTLEVSAFRTPEGLRVNTTAPLSTAPMNLALFNAAGQALWNRTISPAGRSNSTLINLSGATDGLFILTVRQGDLQVTRRVVM